MAAWAVRGWGVRLCLGLGLGWLGACGLPAWEEEAQACEALLPGDIVITEYLNDPAGVDTGKEYVEVHNPTRETVDLLGVTLFTAREEGAQERAYTLTTTLPLDAGTFVVLGDVRDGPCPSTWTRRMAMRSGRWETAGDSWASAAGRGCLIRWCSPRP